jgi:hypothetical protein
VPRNKTRGWFADGISSNQLVLPTVCTRERTTLLPLFTEQWHVRRTTTPIRHRLLHGHHYQIIERVVERCVTSLLSRHARGRRIEAREKLAYARPDGWIWIHTYQGQGRGAIPIRVLQMFARNQMVNCRHMIRPATMLYAYMWSSTNARCTYLSSHIQWRDGKSFQYNQSNCPLGRCTVLRV